MTGSTDPTIRQIQRRALGLALLAALLLGALVPRPFTVGLLAGALVAQLNFFLLARAAATILRGSVARAKFLAGLGFLARYGILALILTVLVRWQVLAGFGAVAGFLTIVGAILTSLAMPFTTAPAPREA